MVNSSCINTFIRHMASSREGEVNRLAFTPINNVYIFLIIGSMSVHFYFLLTTVVTDTTIEVV